MLSLLLVPVCAMAEAQTLGPVVVGPDLVVGGDLVVDGDLVVGGEMLMGGLSEMLSSMARMDGAPRVVRSPTNPCAEVSRVPPPK